ncbi:elongation factor P 5-aminopentanone reductase [Butyricicoccus porcorum]|uniref:3-oxoacyl-ACP reductase n=1 Tax=Butyricicoccus porcorum TaxID=1945634 RepID=A0A252F3I9_9FIRM|nr:SDR family NAD(P)-dependent oxidoreductase [Butyricicoccus porcorum]MCI6925658.1 SDR family oxidoreductase [Butyricicoccus porcorum]MDY4482520.1 SDR family NAD(P)-dependent oxidoreductase [Butyricicoccus porcorum]OUM20358.1 3-oxoacyl-ACP reductase [Butyricicoccus porcorum]
MSKSVLITGAARGIGRACALKFAKEGWNVTACYARAQHAAQSLEEEIRQLGTQCRCVQADVTDSAAVHRLVLLAQAEFGTPDAVVCNAGMAQQKLFADITEDDWDTMFDVNVKGMYRVIREVLPQLLDRQAGSIVTVSSIWGQTGGSCEVHYSASKAAVIGMTKALAKELGLSGIRVNCVAPGVIDTDMNRMHGEDVMQELAEETPLGRNGTPEEVADVIYWLASEQSKFVTGQVLGVNGGFYI